MTMKSITPPILHRTIVVDGIQIFYRKPAPGIGPWSCCLTVIRPPRCSSATSCPRWLKIAGIDLVMDPAHLAELDVEITERNDGATGPSPGRRPPA
jgi:hypothetical protein